MSESANLIYLCTHVYVYIHIFINTYIYIYIHIFIHIYQRNEADLRKRELNLQMGWAHAMHASAAAAGQVN